MGSLGQADLYFSTEKIGVYIVSEMWITNCLSTLRKTAEQRSFQTAACLQLFMSAQLVNKFFSFREQEDWNFHPSPLLRRVDW
jgi:hypothetical protein